MSTPSVNITTQLNTISVNENGDITTVTATTQGPQGPEGTTIDIDNAVSKSLVYYDSTSSSLKADATWTTSTVTDGGNF